MDNERKDDGSDSKVDPSTKKRELESGTEPSKGQKRQNQAGSDSEVEPEKFPFVDGWVSSDTESELDDYFISKRLVIWNLHDDTSKKDIDGFFGGKTESVKIDDCNSQGDPIKTAYICFKSPHDVKEALKKHGESLLGHPVRMRRVPNKWIVLSVSGFEPGLVEENLKEQLRSFFKSCGVIRKIFIPKDKNTGQCLSFGYVYMKQKGTKAEAKDSDEMNGCKISVSNCTWELKFRKIKELLKAEGGWESEAHVNDADDPDDSDCENVAWDNFDDDDDEDEKDGDDVSVLKKFDKDEKDGDDVSVLKKFYKDVKDEMDEDEKDNFDDDEKDGDDVSVLKKFYKDVKDEMDEDEKDNFDDDEKDEDVKDEKDEDEMDDFDDDDEDDDEKDEDVKDEKDENEEDDFDDEKDGDDEDDDDEKDEDEKDD